MISHTRPSFARPLALCLLLVLSFGAGCIEDDRTIDSSSYNNDVFVIDDDTNSSTQADLSVTIPREDTPDVRLYSQLAHIIGKSEGFDLSPIELTNQRNTPRNLRISMPLQGYSTTINQDVQLGVSETKEVTMTPVMDLEKIYALTSEVRSNIEVVVYENNAPIVTLNQSIVIQPINRFTWFVTDTKGELLADLRAFVLTMAIPNDRDGAVAQLISEAAMYMPDGNIPTPESTGEDWSILIANAIYNALQARQLFYSNITGSFFDGAQYVRLPSESLRAGGANCIDGSLLFISALEAVGVPTSIIFVEGHAFMGFYRHTDPDGTIFPIETTVVRDASFEDGVGYGVDILKYAQDNKDPYLAVAKTRRARAAGIIPMSL